MLRVSESPYDNTDRARSLRQLIGHEGFISRTPTTGERGALETGRDALGVPRARYGQVTPRAPAE